MVWPLYLQTTKWPGNLLVAQMLLDQLILQTLQLSGAVQMAQLLLKFLLDYGLLLVTESPRWKNKREVTLAVAMKTQKKRIRLLRKKYPSACPFLNDYSKDLNLTV